MQVAPTFAGVPMEFFVVDVLASLFLACFWWSALLVGGLLYGIAYLGTTIEPRWGGMLWQYCSYVNSYEG
jgi:type IV secretory pathway VirB3-like protein